MNSEQKELLARASRMESIEVFQRDVEPSIVAARDQLMTRENYRGYFRNDVIARNNVGDHVLYAFISRSYDFDEHDPVRVRDVFDAALSPLGFECSEKADVLQDGTTDTVTAARIAFIDSLIAYSSARRAPQQPSKCRRAPRSPR